MQNCKEYRRLFEAVVGYLGAIQCGGDKELRDATKEIEAAMYESEKLLFPIDDDQ